MSTKPAYFLCIRNKGLCPYSGYTLAFSTAQFMSLVSRVDGHPEKFTFHFTRPSDEPWTVPHGSQLRVELRSTTRLLRSFKTLQPVVSAGEQCCGNGCSLLLTRSFDPSGVFPLHSVEMTLHCFGEGTPLRHEWDAVQQLNREQRQREQLERVREQEQRRKRVREHNDAVATEVEENVLQPLRKKIKVMKKKLEDRQQQKLLIRAQVQAIRLQETEVEVVTLGGPVSD